MDEILARLRALEDRAEIAELIARYGPIVDSGEGDLLRDVWTPEGVYRIGQEHAMSGDEIPALTALPGHQEFLQGGCGHVLSAPTISIEGDTAVAVNYSMLVLREGDQWVVSRLSSNRWQLARTESGWRAIERHNELLDGEAAARRLFSQQARVTVDAD